MFYHCIAFDLGYLYLTLSDLRRSNQGQIGKKSSSDGSVLTTFMGAHGSLLVRTRPWSTEFSDSVATGFTQTITKGTWLEELDYVND